MGDSLNRKGLFWNTENTAADSQLIRLGRRIGYFTRRKRAKGKQPAKICELYSCLPKSDGKSVFVEYSDGLALEAGVFLQPVANGRVPTVAAHFLALQPGRDVGLIGGAERGVRAKLA